MHYGPRSAPACRGGTGRPGAQGTGCPLSRCPRFKWSRSTFRHPSLQQVSLDLGPVPSASEMHKGKEGVLVPLVREVSDHNVTMRIGVTWGTTHDCVAEGIGTKREVQWRRSRLLVGLDCRNKPRGCLGSKRSADVGEAGYGGSGGRSHCANQIVSLYATVLCCSVHTLLLLCCLLLPLLLQVGHMRQLEHMDMEAEVQGLEAGQHGRNVAGLLW